MWGRLVWGRLVWGRLVWGRAPRPSKPSEARQLPTVTSTLDVLAASSLRFRWVLLPRLSLRKAKLMFCHVHPHPAERHPFHAQTESLLRGVFTRQLDGPARADHTLPRQSRNLPQYAHNLTCGSRPARSLGDRPVTRHRSRRQGPNTAHHADAPVVHLAHPALFPCPGLRFPIHRSTNREQRSSLATNDQRRTTITRYSC